MLLWCVRRSRYGVQLELDLKRFEKFIEIQNNNGSATHSEAVRRLIDLVGYIKRKIATNEEVDIVALKTMFFPNLNDKKNV